MRYKILFISSWFPNQLETTNGNFVRRHANAASLLHDVEILHAIGNPNQEKSYIFNDQIIDGIRTLVIYYQQTQNPLINFFRRMKAYNKGFRQMHSLDLVHGNILQNNMLFALWLKMRYGIPYIISEHWSGFLKINRSKLSATKILIARIIAWQADFILPVSKSLQKNLEKLKIGNHYQIIENVINTEIFFAKKETKVKPFVFLHVSNLLPLKNPKTIIKATVELHKKYPEIMLKIGGDGDTDNLKRQIKELNAEAFIQTFDELTLEEVAEKMRESNCFVLFSRYESFGIVLLESISCGTPVITTNVGVVPDFVNHTNGLIIEHSEKQLLESMEMMVSEPFRFASPNKMHQYVEDTLSSTKIAEKMSKVYHQVWNKYNK